MTRNPEKLPIGFALNGDHIDVEVAPHELLIDVLRDRLGLTGTKKSCDVEICGACTVLVEGLPASSCTTLAADVDGKAVTTIEGVSCGGKPGPVQQAFIDCGAIQCGFCTPGMVMVTTALIRLHPKPKDEQIKHFLRGNICRCTGYVKIIEGVKSLA
ncbi:(2Fe-2S)-binding protein [Ramlibacter tataouinensis]|uniref:(2Fe-2S)-binding protein n=1 Tax=Ramlibacter tataouinensis TaxID=94132 RepID=UPI0022F393AA|nr:(2Fe-2S)-binding protein [Ramlibacter tataouinensis]WBY00547.1 (2Fe-2S)-binding protein [Ramlibacter tataouinensis]